MFVKILNMKTVLILTSLLVLFSCGEAKTKEQLEYEKQVWKTKIKLLKLQEQKAEKHSKHPGCNYEWKVLIENY